ncbi:cysteine peptidase family C39 domain-containing protein [Pedobacter sp. ASV12]|uniref:cysteine peptidase family C39 domain-containing protein n=1 Tax=Pedobacter sp. ASV12 TaxID=2795120 RepID=UPI0018EAE348|nr:cysteine peptidase family C39 domain-containing protein [Pedobacter sp. ASV12]
MTLFSSASQANAVAVTALFLKKLKVKFTNDGLQQVLEDHPEYPSLLAISDCLTEWHIPNQAYKIAKEDYSVEELEFPFIAHSAMNGGNFMLIHAIKNGKVTYSNEKHKQAIMPEEEFLKKWSGVVLHAEPNEESIEPNYKAQALKENFNNIKVPALLLVALGAVLLSIDYQTLQLNIGLVLFIKLVGLVVGVLLLMHSIDANNPLIQNLCSLGDKNNCNAILKSDAAKVTSWLSWSEVGFFYFAGSFLALLVTPASAPIIGWLNLLSLPYTVYSIGYQYKNKNWCVLCCSVQALLWLEFFVIFFIHPTYALILTPEVVLTTAVSFLLPILAWAFVKPFLARSAQFKPLKEQLKKFKYNSELFEQVLKNQPRYAVPNELMPVVLGNPAAEIVITMVSNPFCGPCAKAHQTIDEWLSYRDDIQLKIIFTTANHDDDARTKVSRHVSALTTLNDPKLVEKALNDWYAQSPKKYETWAEKFPISFNGEMDIVTEKQKAWCDMAEIAYTPTILINGYKLPEPYRLEDIKYLLT